MYILDKYIVSKIAKSYLLILFAFIGLYIVVDLFSNLGDFLREKVPFYVTIDYYLYMTPLIFLRVSPFSLLISVIYTFSELNKTNEIIGMRSLGLSVFRLSFPAIIIALLVSFSSLFVQEKILINSQKKIEEIKLEYMRGKDSSSYKEERNIAFRHKNSIFFISRFIPKKNLLEEVIIFKEDSRGNIKEKVVSRKIIYKQNSWIAKNSISYKLDPSGRIVDKPIYWEERKIELDEKPQNLAIKRSIFSEFASIKDLRKEIKHLKYIGAYNLLSNLIIEVHKKIAQALSHFFLVIGVLPFALEVKKRKVGLSSLGLGFIFGFIYYVTFSTSLALGKTSILLPQLCAWVAPLFFLIMGISGLYFLR
jgi:LPS export ABC transporter permease LptG